MIKLRILFIFIVSIVACLPILHGEEVTQLQKIKVYENLNRDYPVSKIKSDSVAKIEVLNIERIEHKNATSLSKALDLEPGVQTSITCANCSSQRITLNGLRGENTTVLIDGIPSFSSVSAFYGMEAVPMIGLSSIEVMRGAGASLTAPEAIGGAINLITINPDKNTFSYETRAGENSFYNQQVKGTYKTGYGGLLLAGQTNQMNFFDVDNNKVAEAAYQNQKSIFAKYDFKESSNIRFNSRIGYQDLELIGGAAERFRQQQSPAQLADFNDFRNGDVRNQFTGNPSEVSDWVHLKRLDYAGSVVYHLSSDASLKLSSSIAKQEQYSIYSHGYDYNNIDYFRFFDLKFNYYANEQHFLTLGIDHKNEEMISSSDKLYITNNYNRDSFQLDTFGVYLQDEWFISSKDELNLVLRLDQLNVNWDDKRLAQNKLSKGAFAPRLHYKRTHNEQWNSRFSLGMGYRAPLTLFESQHGTNESGFTLNITDLEQAQNLTYTLGRDDDVSSSAFSYTITKLKNMAYGEEGGSRIVFKNAQDSYYINVLNFLHSHKVNPDWSLEASMDWFIMPDQYKEKLPVAAQETRARFVSDYHFNKNEFVAMLNIVGPRNLKDYGYDKDYNVWTQDEFTFENSYSGQKDLRSPLYATMDLFWQREMAKSFFVKAGVNNLFNYTQTKKGDGPLAWREHGDHAHLDNRHIWGPNQGRIVYAGIKFDYE
jgi:outer membrane receptor for ferrienterochelin and colicins